MENQNTNNMGNTGMNSGSFENNNRAIGPIIGLVVILAIILLGGVYFWMTKNSFENSYVAPNQVNNINRNGETAGTVNTSVPSSYNAASIEASLINSNPEEIDTSGL